MPRETSRECRHKRRRALPPGEERKTWGGRVAVGRGSWKMLAGRSPARSDVSDIPLPRLAMLAVKAATLLYGRIHPRSGLEGESAPVCTSARGTQL